MRTHTFFRPLIALIGSLVAGAALTGCATTIDHPVPAVLPLAAGNWQFSSSGANGSVAPLISGSLSGPSNEITGLLHTDVAGSCLPENEVLQLNGWANQFGVVTLTGPAAGGVMTLQGVLSVDGKSLGETWYAVEGGNCPSPAADLTAQNYEALNGTYAGVIKDNSGLQGTLTANLSQSPQPNADGNYVLTGQGTFTAFPCLNGPAQLSNTQVTGQSLKMTYINPITHDSVVVAAQFTSDGQQVTVSNWSLVGGCGSDSGTGKLALQQ
jgi:hypothetical protein